MTIRFNCVLLCILLSGSVLDSALKLPSYREFFDVPLANSRFELKPSNSLKVLLSFKRDIRKHSLQMLS